MKTTLIASLISCHLLWGVACGDVGVEKPADQDTIQEETPGLILFNLSNDGQDSRPAYYGISQRDRLRYPGNEMFEAIERLPKNNRLWTIYPDTFLQAGNTLHSWRDFDVLKWNGKTPLPVMRPNAYIRKIEGFQTKGALPRDLTGYSFLIDWEKGATEVRQMGLTYWADESVPQFRTAWTAYRNQVVDTIRVLQRRFPTAFFTVYAGGSTARLVGQNAAKTAPAFKDQSGKQTAKYYYHDVAKPVRESIRQHYAAAMGPLLEAPDFHTVVCYDAYGPLDWNDQDGFPPKKNETYLVENFRLLKEHSTKPVYGIVGAFTSGNKGLSHGGRSNSAYQMYWKDRGSWLRRTCRWLASGEADGAIVWNGLDAIIFSYLRLDVTSYKEVNESIRRYLEPDQIGGWNQWISLDQQSGTLFNELAKLHGQPDNRNYLTAQRYYDNIPLAQRKSDATINIFLKAISRTWQEYLLDDLRATLQTGEPPLYIENDPIMKSDQDEFVVGATLYISQKIVGAPKSIVYEWMRNGETIGAPTRNPVHLVTESDLGSLISCRITYRPKGRSEKIVRVVRSEEVVRSPVLATIEVLEDGRKAQGNAEQSMAGVFGVKAIESFTLEVGVPITLRTGEENFSPNAVRNQVWKIENGSETFIVEVPSESIRIDGPTMTVDDPRLLKILLSGYRNVITDISLMPSD